MSRKQPIPGVDEAALAALADQFPKGSLPAVAPPAQDNAPLGLDGQAIADLQQIASATTGVPRRKRPGRGLAMGAMMVALLALLIAVTAVMPPPARSWLTRTLGDSAIVNWVTASRAEIDQRMAAATRSIDAIAGKEADVAARLEAVETVVGSGAAMRRLDAAEAGLAAINQRLDAAREAERAATARGAALDARVATFAADLKMFQDRVAANERDVNDIATARLATVEADIGALRNIDRGPERFYLVALQLRDATQTASPFAHELTAAQAVAGNNTELAATLKGLAAEADHGVATVAELRDDFATVVAPRLAAVAAANRHPVVERAWGWVQSMFATASSSSPATDDRNAALIALATRSLAQGQLEAAVHQLLLLEDEAALVAAEWLKNAGARLATDKAIATVMAQALDRLAASH
jgi:hypothetical protein